ncbi:hypothetical protein [Halovivax cerinus]|uniref:Uncharacterized protein n=1 Tax=Halovivax cerinus TaxID=1487865 RepID=A0ABD5NJ41_9EURY|nr:hypothetical protein [Halovivax cerinus]
MNGYGITGIAVVIGVGLVVASMGVVAIEDTSPTEPAVDAAANESTMGAQIGDFMQTSTVATDDSIDRGLFDESLENAPDKEAALRDRIAELEAEYDTLRNRSASLESNESSSEPARRAELTRLAVRLDSFNTSIEETERHARAVGVDTERLDRLRTNASELSGPEIAEIARGLAGVNPPGLRDDPTDRGQGNGSRGSGGGPGNGSSGGPPDDGGPPGEESPPGDGGAPDSEDGADVADA